MKYATAAAFRRALVDHVNERARREGVPVGRLQKQLAFERFLARLFHDGSERRLLQGGYALELRLARHGRATRDLDSNVPPPAATDLLDVLQRVVERDVGDYFTFIVGLPASRSVLAGPPLGGYRFSVEERWMDVASIASHSTWGRVTSPFVRRIASPAFSQRRRQVP